MVLTLFLLGSLMSIQMIHSIDAEESASLLPRLTQAQRQSPGCGRRQPQQRRQRAAMDVRWWAEPIVAVGRTLM